MTASASHAQTAPSAGGDPRYDRLILAIGQPAFGDAMFDVFHTLAQADRCLAFEAAAPGAWTCVVDAGASAKATQEAFLAHEKDWDTLSLGADIQRRRIARLIGVSDVFAFTTSAGRRQYAVLAVRERNGLFTAEQLSALSEAAEIVGACLIKDRQKPASPFERGDGVISRVIMGASAFECLTNREKSVCVGILTGHTTEAIALHLGISANSVLTFRRRTYQKLRVNSQNELFMRVLETAESL